MIASVVSSLFYKKLDLPEFERLYSKSNLYSLIFKTLKSKQDYPYGFNRYY